MNRDRLLIPVAIAVLASMTGTIGFFIGRDTARRSTQSVNILWDYVYHSTVDDKLAIEIKPDGSSNIGPTYDRLTEARKLFELVKAWKDEGRIADCHETSYRSPLSLWSAPDRGVMYLNTYPANPPTPRSILGGPHWR